MDSQTIRYRRSFDWFSIIYAALALGGISLVLLAFGQNPFVAPGMRVLAILVIVSQVFYLVMASKSPVHFNLDEKRLVVQWPRNGRTVEIPRHELHVKKSYLFNSGYWVSSMSESFYLFADHRGGKKLIDALANERESQR